MRFTFINIKGLGLERLLLRFFKIFMSIESLFSMSILTIYYKFWLEYLGTNKAVKLSSQFKRFIKRPKEELKRVKDSPNLLSLLETKKIVFNKSDMAIV